jgi:YVTN family beta-propeller protein
MTETVARYRWNAKEFMRTVNIQIRFLACLTITAAMWLLNTGCRDSATAPLAARSDAQTLNTGKDIRLPMLPPTPLGGFPVGLTPSADGKFALVCGMGYRESLYSISTVDGHIACKIDFPNRLPEHMAAQTGVDTNAGADPDLATNGIYYGVVVAGDTVYAAQGAHDSIAVLSLAADGSLAAKKAISTKAGDFPAGLAIDGGNRLYVTNNSAGDAAVPASLAIYDLKSQVELGRYTFDSDTHTSNFALGVAVLANGSKAYCASERDGCVYVLNTTDPTHPTKSSVIATGSHPLAMLLNHDQSRLFVTNAQSDTVSVIDTATDAVVGTVLLRPGTSRGLPGVSPTALALSPDEKTLYVTLADMNAVGVVDVASLTLSGMIPAGWYPTAVLATADQRLLVVNAKGTTARNPNPKNNPLNRNTGKDPYILNVVQGNVIELKVPGTAQLADLTDTVIRDNHLDDLARQKDNPLAGIGLAAGKIKHVIYIIKENRTYDQILGDDARGNGDPSIVLFGKNVTPNEHALADRFVLLDNCYACGEVSGDGWTWSTQSMANEYVERNIPYNYSSRGRNYDFEGENNGYITGGFPATGPDGKPLSTDPAYKNGAPPVTDVAAIGVHLWDRAKEAGISYRNYGCFLSTKNDRGAQPFPAYYPTVQGLQPPGHDLDGLTDIDFPSFNLDFPDSEAPKHYFDQTQDKNCKYRLESYGKYHVPSRFTEWNREFQEMLAKDPAGSAVPALMLVRLPHDHTQGLAARRHSPAAEIADNDYGVGQLVDAVSHSPVWQSTAIFIIEDDAQNGPDHVDAHRTTAYVISPWIKRGSVDHRFCNTDTLLKTMELLLGLQPMSQYDALALPLMDWDTTPSNAEPYDAVLPPREIIAQTNPILPRLTQGQSLTPLEQLAAASDQMDFTHADAAPADLLNQIIWKSVKGADSHMPRPRNSLVSPVRGMVAPVKKKDDDDDD